ncbi:MAG: hypothetical protein QME55_08145, partial [Brevundimonas sp.]|nr:hypothetical protein [Brevundimonas sp.]
MTSWAFIAAMLSTFASPQDALPQSPPPPQDPPEATATLEDVVVEGRALEEMVREFVGEVGAPAGRRGLARWHDRLCVGVVNVRPDLGHPVGHGLS